MHARLTSLLMSVLLMGSGCVPFKSDGTTHYLVIGIGVVSVNNTNKTIAQVTRVSVAGFMASELGVVAGFVSQASIAVKTNENIAIEVQQLPFKPIKVCVPSYSP